MSTVGIDIGGANLKYASASGQCHSREFAMWRRWHELADKIAEDLQHFDSLDTLAVTMTGELADCFLDAEQGVHHILASVEQAASQLGVRQVAIYAAANGFLDAKHARRDIDHVAASNWHALASWVGRRWMSSVNGLLIDIGSTTTDIIPVHHGVLQTNAMTDFDRLVEGSLVYVGCQRTPVCALIESVQYRGSEPTVMKELFATIDDARVILGTAEESAETTSTADGRSRTRQHAMMRLARVIGLDRRRFTLDDAEDVSRQIVDAAKQRIAKGMQRVIASQAVMPTHIMVSGHGDDLLPDTPGCERIQLTDLLNDDLSRVAPALAVAALYDSQ